MNNTYTNPDDWYKDHWQDLKDYTSQILQRLIGQLRALGATE